MKWVGQHIWDFVSRFRSDVYLEKLNNAGGNTNMFLVAKSSDKNKIYFRTAADVLSDIGASSESTDLEFNGNTTNGVLTYGNTTTADVESTFTYNGSGEVEISSNLTKQPSISLTSSYTGVTAGQINFIKTVPGAINDSLGMLNFAGQDSAGGSQTYGGMGFTIGGATNSKEAGTFSVMVAAAAAGQSNLRSAFNAVGTTTTNRVDTTIGYGTASTSTIAGNLTVTSNLTVNGTTTTINTTDLNVEDKNITLNYNASSDTSGTANGAGITVQDAINAATDASILWNATDDQWETDYVFSTKALDNQRDEILMNTNGSGSGESLTLRSTSQGGNKQITFPNATGTVALTSDIPRSIMAAAQPNATLIYLWKGLTWQGANGSFQLDYGSGGIPNTSDTGATLAQQVLVPIVHAISSMTVYKVTMNWYWTTKYGSVQGSRNFEFSFHTATALNNNQAEQTLSSPLNTTNNNGAYTNDRQYITTWEFASGGGYPLSAGDNLNIFARMNFGSSSTTISSPIIGQIWIEYKYN